VIDEHSPLRSEDAQSLAASSGLLILSVSGTDETTGQKLMARVEYPAAAIHWHHSFIDILETSAEGALTFDYAKFHDVEPLPAPLGAESRAAAAALAARAATLAAKRVD